MQYRFYLDGIRVVENPIGWDAMTVDIVRDNDLKGVFVKVVADLTFTSDGYDYIKGLYDSSDYCTEIAISVHRSIDNGANFIERYKGLLYLSDMVFDDFNCSVKTKFTDDSFYGRIDNRRSAEAYLTGTRTINSEDDNITPPTINSMVLFNPATGAASIVQSHGIYKVYDVLAYLIGFMTDNLVDFDSPLFGPSGDFSALGLTYGFSIRATGNANDLTLGEFTQEMPPITFATLFKELDHRLNIGMFVDTTGPRPKIIIDRWQELFISTDVTTFPNLPNLKTSIAKELIYSNIKFGGSKVLDIPAASFPELIRFVGFNKEQYLITGKCNVDNTLDLSYDFISSSNVIEQILILSGTDETYDKDWFLIDCEITGLNILSAIESNWLDPTALTPVFYNESLTNFEISKRYLGFVPNTIAAFLGNEDQSFRASSTADEIVTGLGDTFYPLFQDDVTPPNHDVNGNYTPATRIYVCPTSGVYSFHFYLETLWEFSTAQQGVARVFIDRWDTGSVTLLDRQEVLFLSPTSNITPPVILEGTGTINANATDEIRLLVNYADKFRVTTKAGSYWECTNTEDGGGIYQTYEPSNYPIILNEFTTEIFDSQTDAIVAAPLSKLAFYVDPALQKSAWIDDVSINEFTGIITAKVLSSRTQEPELPDPIIQYVIISGNMAQNTFTMSPADNYGNGSSDTTIKCYFFRVGKQVTVNIPATFGGTTPNPGQSFLLTRMFEDSSQTVEFGAGTSFTFTVEAGVQYLLNIRYDWTTVGNTFPLIRPFMFPPTVPGGVGIMSVSPLFPAGTYTYLWSNGSVLNQISGVAGTYTCLVTCTTCALTSNSILFTFEMPNSETGV